MCTKHICQEIVGNILVLRHLITQTYIATVQTEVSTDHCIGAVLQGGDCLAMNINSLLNAALKWALPGKKEKSRPLGT